MLLHAEEDTARLPSPLRERHTPVFACADADVVTPCRRHSRTQIRRVEYLSCQMLRRLLRSDHGWLVGRLNRIRGTSQRRQWGDKAADHQQGGKRFDHEVLHDGGSSRKACRKEGTSAAVE